MNIVERLVRLRGVGDYQRPVAQDERARRRRKVHFWRPICADVGVAAQAGMFLAALARQLELLAAP